MAEHPTITPEHMRALEETSNLVGKINASWGDVQYFIYLIFVYLMSSDVRRAKAIFFAIRTDRAQRDITLAVADRLSQISDPGNVLADLKKLLERANKLSGKRNDAIHAMWGIRATDMIPAPLAGSSPRLASEPIKATLENSHSAIRELALDFADLSDQIGAIEWPSFGTPSQPANQPEASSAESDPPHSRTST